MIKCPSAWILLSRRGVFFWLVTKQEALTTPNDVIIRKSIFLEILMKKRIFLGFLLILTLFTLQFLFSCGSTPQNDVEISTPAMSNTVTQSPAVTALAPTPAPSFSPALSPSPSESASKIPETWNDNGIFSEYYEKSYARLEQMTLEEKISQMMLVRCPQDGAVNFIKNYQPGGLVLFEVDFKGKTMDTVISTIESYQQASNIPLIISTDEEGGSVVRISRNRNLSDYTFQSPQKLYNNGGLEAVRDDALIKAALLKKLGLNLNLAPVADVSTNPGDYIYARSFGHPAAETGDYVVTVLSAMQECGISSALKHFPGYGSNTDTHTGIAVDNRPYSTFAQSDFIPFAKGIAAGSESILISHNMTACMDQDIPASLSPAVHQILRDTLNFTGIIITDDLSMEAVKDSIGNINPAALAVLAGNDMLILQDYESAFITVLTAVNSGELSTVLIDHAVFRILAWKMARGIIV